MPLSRKICSLAILLATTASGAEAKIGESIDRFKVRVQPIYKLKSTSTKQDRSYFMFSLVPTADMKEKTPGFAVSLTLTVVDKKILGQSMAVRFGANYDDGKQLAAVHTMDFVYESMGKPAPKPEQQESEISQFRGAIEQVMAGVPQHVSYPGYNQLITLSRTADGDLLVAVTPDFRAGTKKPGAK